MKSESYGLIKMGRKKRPYDQANLNMYRGLSANVDEETYQFFNQRAKTEQISVSNLIRKILEQYKVSVVKPQEGKSHE